MRTLDLDNKKSLKFLKYKKFLSAGFIHEEDIRLISGVSNGKIVPGGQMSQITGMTLKGNLKGNILILTSFLNDTNLRELMQYVSGTSLLFHKTLQISSSIRVGHGFLFVNNLKEYYHFVKTCCPSQNADTFVKKYRGGFCEVDPYKGFSGFLARDAWRCEDDVIASTTQNLLRRLSWSASYPWIVQGFKSYFTNRIHNSFETPIGSESSTIQGFKKNFISKNLAFST